MYQASRCIKVRQTAEGNIKQTADAKNNSPNGFAAVVSQHLRRLFRVPDTWCQGMSYDVPIASLFCEIHDHGKYC